MSLSISWWQCSLIIWSESPVQHNDLKVWLLFKQRRHLTHTDLERIVHLSTLKEINMIFFNKKKWTWWRYHRVLTHSTDIQFHYQMQADENTLHGGCFLWDTSCQLMINDVALWTPEDDDEYSINLVTLSFSFHPFLSPLNLCKAYFN